MKKIFYIALSAAIFVTSCGKFGDTNTDPEHLNEGNVPIEMVFTNGLHQALGSDWDAWRTKSIGIAQWIQQLASCRYWEDLARFCYREDLNSSYWDIFSGDRGAFFQITWCMDKWAEMGDEYVIDYNIARVMHAYVFENLTDLYGDVPYTQACRPDKYSYPAYDVQKDIYTDILKELDEAQAVLKNGGTAKMGNADIYYQGNAASWAKFANSLMLRAAMRLVKVDAATAKTYAEKAYSNGLISSIAENAKLDHKGCDTGNDSQEAFAKIHAQEDREFLMAETFTNMLANTNDPRAALIATRCLNAQREFDDIRNGATANYYGNPDPALMRGFPSGFNNWDEDPYNFYVGHIAAHSDFDNSIFASQYSTVNRYTYSDPECPTFICTYPQTELLLAEAAYRGWSVGASAKTHYENAIKAAMAQFSQFPNSYVPTLISTYLTDAAVAAYMAGPDVAWNEADALKLINNQYYIVSFGDEIEVFNNWRRSGYPELQVPIPVTGGSVVNANGQSVTVTMEPGSMCRTIPRRLQYPTDEVGKNATNYKEAVGRSANLTNGDKWDSRVWWDK